MKKQLLAICGLIIFSMGEIKAQLSGSYSVPGSYTSVAAAINDLNTQGISGAVTINIAAGYTETAPLGGFTLTATGTLANPITFQKSGIGANPLITAATGGTAVPTSAIQDGIWSLVGSDYITIDAIDIMDPNTSNPSTMEYGYGLFKASTTNGCQNNTIKNCVITLNKVNNAAGILPAVEGSRGINVVNSTMTVQTTALTIASAAGANSNNKFYSNTIENVNVGIAIIGFASTTPFTNSDTGNDIGGSSAATGNIIVNFGGGAATSAAAGIRTLAQYNINVSNNIVTNNNGLGANHAAAIRGIYLGAATSANATINSNTVTITSAVTTATVSLIENASGATASNNTITITNNLLANSTNTAATSSPWYGIWNNASAAHLLISGNTFTNNATRATTGTYYTIYNNGAVASSNRILNNNISFNHDGTNNYTGTSYGIFNSGSTINTTLTISGNNFASYTHSTTSSGAIYFIYNSGSSHTYLLTNNLINNLSMNHTGTEAYLYNLSSTQYSLSVSNNTITNITRNAAGGTTYCYYSSASSLPTSTQTINGNLISNITATAVSGTGAFYSIYNSDGATAPYPKKIVSNNIISNINYSSTSTYYGMYVNYLGEGTSGSGSSIFNNLFDNITWNGFMYIMYPGSTASPNYPTSVYTNTMSNITSNGGTSSIFASYLWGSTAGLNFYQNRTYNITENGGTGIVYGIYVATPNGNIYNNLVGAIATPSSTGANRLNGIYVGSGNTAKIYFNTVYMDGTSTGANFGSNALYVNTTYNVDLRSNIFVNNCTPTGFEYAVAYRRSSTNLATYNAASNNNLFYASVPSASTLIYYDGFNMAQTLSAFQALVAPMDALSVTENPNFVSVVGSNPNFLNINPSSPTLIESGGTAVPGITTDYVNTTRNPSTPDIGAWEGNFTAVNTCSGTPLSGTTAISSPTGCPNYVITLTNSGHTTGAGMSFQWQSAPAASGPWTNIIGANGSTHTTTATGVIFFRFVVTCTASALSATTSPVSFTVVNPGPCVCNNYGPSNATSTFDEEILNVTFSSLNSTSSCTTIAPGPGSIQQQYGNYAGFLAAPTVTQGQTVTFTVQIGTCNGNYSNAMAIYIDYNQNGLFTDAGEQVYLSAATTVGPHFESGNVTIPMTALVGLTRMRVVNVETSPAFINPTGTYTWGETEDYCIDIAQAVPCAGAPATPTTAITTPTGCPNSTFVITSTVTVATGITNQWYSSPSPTGPWSAITNATNTSYGSSTNTTTYYQIVSTCSNSAMSASSAPVSFSVVNPGPCVCSSYGPSGASNTFDEEILNVTFDVLNSSSTCTTVAPGPGSIQNRYSNYVGFVAAPTVTQGQTVSFTVQIGTCNGNFGNSTAIYIDYNQNGLFTDAGEQVYLSSAATTGPHLETGNVTIPMSALVGTTRMRVINVETTLPSSIGPTSAYTWGETEDYCVDIAAAPVCSGAPASGTAAINTPTGCPNATFVVNATGVSIGIGIQYQWYSSPSATGPWSAITNATNTSYGSSTNTTTYYQMVTTCTISSMSATTSVVSYSIVNPGPCICAGYPGSSANFAADEEIFNVTFGPLNNNSTCTSVGPGPGSILSRYSNYSGFVAAPTVFLGQSVPFSVNVGTCGGNFNSGISIFIDYNHNGVFTDAGEQAYLSAASINGPYIQTGNITIPLTANLGITRMRVVNMETTVMSSIMSNNTYGYGETEDYCVDIQSPPPCAGAPNSGTAAISTATGCISDPFNVTANGTTFGTGISYQWYSAPSASGPWTAISNATATTYSATSASTIFFQMVTTCSNSAMSATTSIVSYTPYQCYTMSNTTITSCTGTLYDSGGPLNAYQNNENYTLTIVPSAANSSVMISFTTFSLETNWDYLYIYDGNSTAAPLIGQYTGATLPPNALATNAAGILTLRMTSDGIITWSGFQAALSCSNSCMGPPSAPAASGSVICSGNSATLTTVATGTAMWYATSTPTNAIATGSVYVTPTLTANVTYYVSDSTICGNSSLTPVTITVNPLPSVLSVTSASICSGNSATISAQVTGNAEWFATSTPTSPLSTNTLYTTPILNNTTTYYVRDTSMCGSSSLTPVTVTVAPTPTMNVSSSSNTICAGKSATLTATSMDTYTWSTMATTSSIVVSPTVTTTYTITGNDALCNTTQTAAININVNALPVVSLSASGVTTICATNGSIGLVGSPAGGIYSGTAVSGTLLSIANAGTFVPMYSYTSPVTGCSNTATVQVIVVNCSTGMNSPQITSTAGFRVYPNPNFGTFTIETGNELKKAIELTDLAGRVVYKETTSSDTIQINIEELANGVYQMTVQSENGINIIKIVKQ